MWEISINDFFGFIIKKANNNGNKRVRNDPKTNSSPKKEETLLFSKGDSPIKLTCLKY